MEASYHSSCYIIQKRKHKEKKTLFFYLCEADVKKNAKPRCELFRLVEGEKGF